MFEPKALQSDAAALGCHRRSPLRPAGTLVDAIYDAALEPRKWFGVLSRLTERLDCSAAVYSIHDAHDRHVLELVAITRGAEFEGPVRFHYAAPYLWSDAGVTVPQDSPPFRLSILDPDSFAKCKAYIELQTLNRTCNRLEAFEFRKSETRTKLTLFRLARAQKFGIAERNLLGKLRSHFLRAARIYLEFVGLQRQQGAQRIAFECLPVGTVLLDPCGHVLEMNGRAKDILSRTDVLKISARRLVGSSARDTAKLRNMIRRTQGGVGDRCCDGTAVVRIGSASMRRPLAVLAMPWPEAVGVGGAGPASVVLLFDSESQPDVQRDVLSLLYQLTPAETRLVEALVLGDTLDDAAVSFGISKQTARKQLSNIYQKTDTHRQSELVALVLCGPAALCRNETR